MIVNDERLDILFYIGHKATARNTIETEEWEQ